MLYEGGQLLAVHSNPNDEGQTLDVEEPNAPTPEYKSDAPKTGDASDLLIWMLIASGAIVLAATGIILIGRNSRKKKQ